MKDQPTGSDEKGSIEAMPGESTTREARMTGP